MGAGQWIHRDGGTAGAFEWQPLTGSLTDLLVQVVLAGFRSLLRQANGAH